MFDSIQNTPIPSRHIPQSTNTPLPQDNFRLSGFPGIDQEFEDLMKFTQPVHPANGTILDLSCGSGLMARRLVRTGGWARVIAADYSESMLRETKGRFRQERLPVPTLVRADAARLPFRTGSLDAIHAGAWRERAAWLGARLVNRVGPGPTWREHPLTTHSNHITNANVRRRPPLLAAAGGRAPRSPQGAEARRPFLRLDIRGAFPSLLPFSLRLVLCPYTGPAACHCLVF